MAVVATRTFAAGRIELTKEEPGVWEAIILLGFGRRTTSDSR